MIKAFKLVNDVKSNTKLMYVGSGNLEEDVKEYAKQAGILDKIIITGWVSNVEEYIPAFDIAVLPSKWEGFGLVLIEYMACDKPIVASDIGGIPDIIKDKENGLLCKCNDYKDLSEKLLYLINNNEIAYRMIENNIDYRKKYDIKLVVKKYEELFKGE